MCLMPLLNVSQDFIFQIFDNGDALWQNGITFVYRSIMIIYPKQDHGIVVQTNSESDLPVAIDITKRSPGSKALWKYL